jgi:uncharacterized membrane protein YesL
MQSIDVSLYYVAYIMDLVSAFEVSLSLRILPLDQQSNGVLGCFCAGWLVFFHVKGLFISACFIRFCSLSARGPYKSDLLIHWSLLPAMFKVDRSV